MRKGLDSNPPKGKKDEITQEFQCVSHELCKILENPEFKNFENEKVRSKLMYVMREEYYYLIEDNSEESQQYKENNSYAKRFINNFYNKNKL